MLNFWTSRRAAGDGVSDATEEERRGRWRCRAEARTWSLPDAVRATKMSSTSVASGTTAEKGATDKNKATTNRNLSLKGKKSMLCAQQRHTLTRCGNHFRNTQMGQYNGFRSIHASESIVDRIGAPGAYLDNLRCKMVRIGQVVGRTETCGSVGEELGGVVFEVTAAVVVWRNVEFAIFHFTFHFRFSFCKTLFLVTHSV